MQIFRFPSFRLCPFYPTGINIGSKRPQHVLKHAEKQEETRRVQSFGAKFGASAAKPHASGELRAKNFARKEPQAQQFKNWFESPNAPLSNAV